MRRGKGEFGTGVSLLCPFPWPLRAQLRRRTCAGWERPSTACGRAYQVQGGAWLLSPRLCDVLMAMDVMLCTASIFNLCAISVDRWAACPPCVGRIPTGPVP